MTNPSPTAGEAVAVASISAVPFPWKVSSSLVMTGVLRRFLLSNLPVLEEEESFLGLAETVKGDVLGR